MSVTCQAASTTTTTPSSNAADSADPIKANLTSTTIAPAIIAIEIVDPNANQTVANRNTKRTIEANLGYGHHAPQLEYYKYSQEDIPPYTGAASPEIFGATTHDGSFPSQQQQQQYPHAPGLQQLYQPGTMLFSQLNSQGQLSQLTPGPPLNTNIQQPVIVVRVRPEQLASLTNGLFPNLPQSHPFASNLNNVDLSTLLSGYAQNALQGQGSGLQYPHPQEQPFGISQQHHQFPGYSSGSLHGFDFGAQPVQAPGYDLSGGQPQGYDFGGNIQPVQGYDFGELQHQQNGGFDLNGGQHLSPVNYDFGGAHQQLLAQGPQLFQPASSYQQQQQQQGGFQFPVAPLAFPQVTRGYTW